VLRILVRSSPETNDHEVVLLGNDDVLLARFGHGAIGLDPDDILVEPCPLITNGSRECLIGRCDCGVIGCGDVRVQIAIDAECVSWSSLNGRGPRVTFDLKAYSNEVARALGDHSWETPDRTAARLIAQGIDRATLARSGLKFAWASDRSSVGLMTIALWLEPGPYQLLVRIPWNETAPPSATADSVLKVLAQVPSSWPAVEWLPQAKGLGSPPIAGSGWRPFRPGQP
jgi:hypothetical protein